MTSLRRRKLGFFLIATVGVAMMVYCLVGMTHGSAVGQPQIVGSGHSGSVDWVVVKGEFHTNISPYYLIPIALCGAVGVLSLVWPARKPPKL